MDTSKNAASIMKRILGNRNHLVILALLGALILILAVPSGNQVKTAVDRTEEEKEDVERRLEKILKNTEGVGEVRVMITKSSKTESFTGEETESGQVQGVVVVAEGADNAIVKKKIQRIVLALFQVEAHKIEIVKMKAD